MLVVLCGCSSRGLRLLFRSHVLDLLLHLSYPLIIAYPIIRRSISLDSRLDITGTLRVTLPPRVEKDYCLVQGKNLPTLFLIPTTTTIDGTVCLSLFHTSSNISRSTHCELSSLRQACSKHYTAINNRQLHQVSIPRLPYSHSVITSGTTYSCS